MSDKRICFNRIYYDPFKKRVFLTETINGVRFKDEIPVNFTYYVEDPENKSDITDIYGKRVIKKVTRDSNSIKLLREAGVFLCESDIPKDIAFLHQRYENVQLKPDIKNFQICYLDIENEVEGAFDPKSYQYPINLLTIKLSKQNQTYTFGLKNELKNNPSGRKYKSFNSEKELLEAFIEVFTKANIDIVTGWNIQYDISTIINRCIKLGIEKTLSPLGKYWQNQRTMEWFIPGISVIDYMQFFKDMKFNQERRESYSLQAICMEELKEGKLNIDGQINSIWKDDWDLFVAYNIQDVELVEKLEKKKKYLELTINICHNSLIPFDKIFSASAIIEGQLLSYLHANNKVMNDRSEGMMVEQLPGAYVESNPGYYETALSYDFEGLYPNLIIHYNISPETLVLNPNNIEGLIKTPLSEEYGIYYKKEKGIFPILLEKNTKERNEFKNLKKKYEKEGNKDLEEYYDSQQKIRKIFNNSFYGVLAMNYFHYYNINMAKTITLGGQHAIKYVKEKINLYFKDYFYKDPKFFNTVDEKNKLGIKDNRLVLLDTDSCYLSFSDIRNKLWKDLPLLEWANKFNNDFMGEFFKKLLDGYFKRYGIENRINFKLEKIISKIVVFEKKNYACMILSNEGTVYNPPKMSVTGFASKRSDKPSYCRKKIDEMLKLFFEKSDRKNLIDQIKEVKKEFRNIPIEEIASPKGMTDYNKYASGVDFSKNILTFNDRTPIHYRASINYNYLIKKHKLPLQPVDSGSKIKYFYVRDDNELRTNVIAFYGKCHEYIKNNFIVDYDQQFQVTFLNSMQKLFDTMKWGEIDIDTKDISEYFEE